MNLIIIPLMAEIIYVVDAKEKKKSEIFGRAGRMRRRTDCILLYLQKER
jgi:hypothetical protein